MFPVQLTFPARSIKEDHVTQKKALRKERQQNMRQRKHLLHQMGQDFGFPVPSTKATRLEVRHTRFLLLQDMDQEARHNAVYIHPTEISIREGEMLADCHRYIFYVVGPLESRFIEDTQVVKCRLVCSSAAYC